MCGAKRVGLGRFSDTYPPEQRIIPLSRWPEQDRSAFETARRTGDVFELPGPAALWSFATCELRIRAYGRFLNFLERNSLLLSIEGPGERVNPCRLKQYLAEARKFLSPRTLDQSLQELRRILCVLAPQGDWRWVTRVAERPSPSDVRASKRPKTIFDPRTLCCAALDLMDHINGGPVSYELGIVYRNALIVAMQCLFSLRRRNLVGMVLGRNLLIDGDLIRLVYGPEETKNGNPISWLLPDFLKPYLRGYLEQYRAVLLAGSVSHAVWISGRDHTVLRYGAIPHLFRSAGVLLLG